MPEAAALVIADEASKPAMHELDIARAIAAGELTSPQQYENLWLFALRVTGTGAAYRRQHDEYVWRDPSLYLNQEFIDRCAGLPVTVEHPPKQMLDSKEFAARIVGTLMFAYIRDKDVWGIARIYDQDTAKLLRSDQYSTSPAVVFRDPSVNTETENDDGSKLLIEGKPSLLDHLALCSEGVWDKGGPPRGVDTGVNTMADGASATTTHDASAVGLDIRQLVELLSGMKAGQDAVMAKLDTVVARTDSVEKKVDAAEKKVDAAERARKDEDEKKEQEEREEKERDDKAKADAARRDAHRARFSRRGDGDDNERYIKRHDAEERELAKELEEKEGKSRDDAKRMAADARKDAETCEEEERKEKRERDDKVTADKAKTAKKDESEEEEEEREKKEERGDSIRVDSIEFQRAVQREVLAHLNAEQPQGERAEKNEMQARFDTVYNHFGLQAPPAMSGETAPNYQRRLMKGLQKHSLTWKDEDLSALPVSALPKIEKIIFADAVNAAKAPDDVPFGSLREATRRDVTGRAITEFYGEPLSWMQQFMPHAQQVVKFKEEGH